MAQNNKSKSAGSGGKSAAKPPATSRTGPKPTKNERREAARREAERLRAEQARREKRNRWILFGALGVVAVLIAVAGYFIWQSSQRTLLDDFDGAVPAGSDEHGGISVGADGVAGSENSDAPNLAVYVDFMCPICGGFEDANAADLDAMRQAGELTVTYHPIAILDDQSLGTQYSTRAANAVATVADSGSDALVPFMTSLFAQQPEEGTEGLSDEEIAQIAVDAGVSQDVADTFADGTFSEWVEVATNQSSRDGVSGTPTVFVNGDRVPTSGDGAVNYMQPGVLATWLQDEYGVAAVEPSEEETTPAAEETSGATPEPTPTATATG